MWDLQILENQKKITTENEYFFPKNFNDVRSKSQRKTISVMGLEKSGDIKFEICLEIWFDARIRSRTMPFRTLLSYPLSQRDFWRMSDFSENIEIYGKIEFRTQTYCLRNLRPSPTAETAH